METLGTIAWGLVAAFFLVGIYDTLGRRPARKSNPMLLIGPGKEVTPIIEGQFTVLETREFTEHQGEE